MYHMYLYRSGNSAITTTFWAANTSYPVSRVEFQVLLDASGSAARSYAYTYLYLGMERDRVDSAKNRAQPMERGSPGGK
jgi:hypothetical protein